MVGLIVALFGGGDHSSGKFVHPEGGHANRNEVNLVFHDGGGEHRLELEWHRGCLRSRATGRYVHPKGGRGVKDALLVFHDAGPEYCLELEEVY